MSERRKDEFLTTVSVYQAAHQAGVSYRVMRAAVDAGELRAYRTGRSIRVNAAELMAWIERRRMGGEDDLAG